MEWLRHGVPVTLIIDLLDAEGPPSRQILTAEAAEDDVRLEQEALARRATEWGAENFSDAAGG